MADGSDDPATDRSARAPRRARRRGRGGVALHARRSAGRRAGREVGALAARGLVAALVRAGRHTRRDELVQGVQRGVRPRGRHRVRRRLRARDRDGRQGAPPPAARRRGADDLARPGRGPVELQGRRRGSPGTSAGTAMHSGREIPAPNMRRQRWNEVRSREVRDEQGLGQWFVRVHRRLRRAGAPRPRPRGRRHRQPLEVRAGLAQLRRPSRVPARRGRRARRRADDRAAQRLRRLHRGRGDDRRHLVLPHVRLRPARDQRAHHRGVVRRGDPRLRRGPAQEGHVPELVDGVRVGDVVAVVRGAGTRGSAAALVVRLPEARRRVLRARARTTSTGCRTRSSGRSTASASAKRARSARSRC